MSEALWVFAYGSLIWRPDFAFEARVRCYVEGYARRFCQASVDHRGTPESPGRVVTLVEAPGERCWGVAYQVVATDAGRILTSLDEREKGGYSRLTLACVAKDRQRSGMLQALAYLANQTNPMFVSQEPVSETAAIIRSAAGPSGHNAEYALRLAEALGDLDVDDPHVFEVANLVSDPESVTEDG